MYFGEALLSMCSIAVVGVICALGRKSVHVLMILSALAFVIGFAVCAVIAIFAHGQNAYSYDPLFLTTSSPVAQIAKIAVISPWAFIGFENITHFSEEYTFELKKVKRILFVSVVLSTVLYILVTLLSVSAYPGEYASWLEYIGDMGNLSGFKAVPAFYAIYHYMGNTGVTILMIALLGAIVTSLIGNTMALSRLLYSAGRDESAPALLKSVNHSGNPANAVYFVVALSLPIPFLGRTAIGWIVDVTTLGATLIYAFVSYAVYKDAKRNGDHREQNTGLAGLILMLLFVLLLLLPNLLMRGVMDSAAYILFVLWAVIGLIYFRKLVIKDNARKYGHSVLVWVILLLFLLFASMMWVTKETHRMTDATINEIRTYYESGAASNRNEDADTSYLQMKSDRIHTVNALFTIGSFALFIVCAGIILSNYKTMKRREEESERKLVLAEKQAVTDELTGTKNRHAFSLKEQELDERIRKGELHDLAVVVCDINNLKLVNDSRGHKTGDSCIIRNCEMICKVFKHSPVFRIGGDEFVAILERDDYEDREQLMELLHARSAQLYKEIGTSMAAGISDFDPDTDESFLMVFTRADELMYARKVEMKKSESNPGGQAE